MHIRHKGLRRLYELDDAQYLNPNHVEKIRRILAFLDDARKPADMGRPDFRLHPLRGDRSGFWSVSVSGNWRITFRFESGRRLTWISRTTTDAPLDLGATPCRC